MAFRLSGFVNVDWTLDWDFGNPFFEVDNFGETKGCESTITLVLKASCHIALPSSLVNLSASRGCVS